MEQIESCVPPGFRFHPTETELVGYYLYRKVKSLKFDLDVIIDIDLYRMEPWQIQDKCKLGYDEQTEWYFFSHKDRKYPTGTRTNRATATGFWKATGRDKAVLYRNKIIGMRKTLVFYKGRAPNGKKTDWIVHEYRLQTTEHAPPQEEGWVICRAFKKPTPSYNQGFGAWHNHQNSLYYVRNSNNNNCNSHNSMICSASVPDMASPTDPNTFRHHQQTVQPFPNFEQEFVHNNIIINDFIEHQMIMELPRPESPALSSSLQSGMFSNEDYHDQKESSSDINNKWEISDNLMGSSSSSISNNNQPSSQLFLHDYELDAKNQLGSNFFGCLPNL